MVLNLVLFNYVIIIFFGIIIPILILRNDEYKEKHKKLAYILLGLSMLSLLPIIASFGPRLEIFRLTRISNIFLLYFFYKLIRLLLKSKEKIERYLAFPLIFYLIEVIIFTILTIIASSGKTSLQIL